MSAKSSETPASMADVKQQIRELKKSVAEAIAAKQTADVKKLRRKKNRLKAETRHLARKAKASAAATTPPAA